MIDQLTTTAAPNKPVSTVVAITLLLATFTVNAQETPVCTLPDSDPDGDGWGWENNDSCVVNGSQAAAPSSQTTTFCLYLSSDQDGDGWGWENNDSCQIGPDSSSETPVDNSPPIVPVVDQSGRVICQTADADLDGDGYGWENNASCIVAGSTVQVAAAAPANPVCSSSDADLDGDGWGWENNASCIVDTDASGSDTTPDTDSPTDTSTDTTTDTSTDTSTDTGSDTSTDTGSDTSTDTGSDTSTDTGSDTSTDTGSDTSTDTGSDTSTNTGSDTSTDTGSDTSTNTGSDPSTDTDSDTSTDTGSDTSTDTGSDNSAPALSAYLPENITDLILVTGQSNTLGSNATVDTNLDAPHPRVFAYTSNGWEVAELYQSWDNGGHPGTGNRDDVSRIHNNFALHFGKRLAELDESIVIGFVLVSEPGEGIAHWAPGQPGLLRVQQKTLEAINALPHKSAVDGILWHQGETDWQLEGTSDPDATQPAPVDYYPVRLTSLIDNLRVEAWFDNSRPFICGETINAEGVNTHLNGLNTDSDDNTACVAGAGLPAIREGGNHFNANALRTIGRRYADRYYQLR